jgi:hypothetical protein
MMKAALPFSPISDGMRCCVWNGMKKAKNYSSFRNRAAHGEPVYDADILQYALGEGSDYVSANIIRIADLDVATVNMTRLRGLLYDLHPTHPPTRDASPEAYLELIRALPNEANSTEPHQSQPKKQPPQTSEA